MDDNSDNESLIAQIRQLEYERDGLHKDIEQLCMQQAGPSYIAVATRMHFQRTAGLEQEIEGLKKKVAALTRDNINLQEELSEAYHIKGQLADLHGAEVLKNMEAEKQIKFFQGCVAAAFSERDHFLMEAEKAKEKEEPMIQKLNDLEKRVEELTSDYLEGTKVNAALQHNLAEVEEQNEVLKKVVDKFYQIRQNYYTDFGQMSWDDKCARLLCDSVELWNFDAEASTSKYISALEGELETLRKSMNNLQYKLRVGLEFENHLKKKVSEIEKKQVRFQDVIKNGISGLLYSHSQHRIHIMKLLDEEKFYIKSVIDMVQEKIGQLKASSEQNLEPPQRDTKLDENERDVYISVDADMNSSAKKNGVASPVALDGGICNATEALALALQEKVATLLLLSQQEERHLLERNVNAALQKKVEELQRNLLQVTNEKVQALMELAQLKREYQVLHEKTGPEMKQGKFLVDPGEKRFGAYERDGKLKSLLKKTYLGRLVAAVEHIANENESQLSEGNFSGRRQNQSMNFASVKIENATLKESIECLERLTSSIQRLRLSLLKAKDSFTSEDSVSEVLSDIISEARLVKTALGSSLPVSWSAVVDVESIGESSSSDGPYVREGLHTTKRDPVSAAGCEMVELVMLAAHMLKDISRDFKD